MAAGSFDVIPIVQDGTGVRIAAVTLAGVSTAHDATDTDNGRMYGVITPEEPGYRLDVYSSIDQTPGSMLASGTVDAVDKGFVLQSAGESGVWFGGISRIGNAANHVIRFAFCCPGVVYWSETIAVCALAGNGIPGFD
jgi:hypothetical protein